MAGLIVSRSLFLVMIGLAAAALDAVLSERRRLEEMRLRALVDQLRESERRLHDANEAKSQFLSRMSHEFRTPLNGIVGLASILGRDASGDQARMLEMIASCGKSLGSMVDAIIDLARFEDAAFTLDCNPFDLGAMLGRLESDYRPKAQAKGLRFAVLADLEDAGSVTGDQERIRQILSGLIDNAIKFTADGGVRIAARYLPDTDEGVRRLEFLVDDTGGGVPDDASVAIFELFGQADSAITRRQDGAGLGLSLARRLCVAMGGGLTFERLPHGGSRFRAEIVLGCAAAPHAAVNDRAMPGKAA
jgi:signal transduction histidine kinase